MSSSQADYVKANSSFEYRQLDFTRFPDHVSILTTYAWKTLIWMEMLMEYNAITWFDTSKRKYAMNKRSSMLYYVHTAGHSTSWATHANMFSYRLWIRKEIILIFVNFETRFLKSFGVKHKLKTGLKRKR